VGFQSIDMSALWDNGGLAKEARAMVNLQTDKQLGATPQPIKDANGNASPLAISTTAVGIGTVQVGKALEVVGSVVERASADAGHSAMLWSVDVDGLGTLWTNARYDPAAHTSRWQRTIDLQSGGVRVRNEVAVGGMSGGNEADGRITIRDEAGEIVAELHARSGDLKIGGHGKDGDITLFPAQATNIGSPAESTIHLDGEAGDIKLKNADIAEEFDVVDAQATEPGDLLIVCDDMMLERSCRPYDTRVAGVVGGAGRFQPGIVLGANQHSDRLPLVLLGRVLCKVDATYAAVEVGDLLTTSPSPGHAMKVTDPVAAFGAVIGKAMGQLAKGQDLIPILVALQ
jgi:hypothetical protein